MFDIYMEQYRNDMIYDLVKFLKIQTVKSAPESNNPYGKGIFDGLMHILNIADKMGFECVNLFGHMAYIDYGEGSETLAILTHIDVVPAGEGWTKKPFGGEIESGRIYGRGAIDDKGPAIAALYALKALSDNFIHLNKKVRLIFGCDEETGWSDMAFYKQHEPLPDIAFSPDGEYPIINAEKGLVHIKLTAQAKDLSGAGIRVLKFLSGERPNVVPSAAQCLLAADYNIIKNKLDNYSDEKGTKFNIENTPEGVLVTARGKSAHGSRPEEGVNAAAALALFLDSLDLPSGGYNDYVKIAAQKIAHTINGELIGLDVSDTVSGRTTLNLGAINTTDNTFSMILDIRYPVSFDEKFVMRKIGEQFAGVFDVKVMHSLGPLHIDENSGLIVKLKEAYEEITGQKAYCLSTGGATYARAFENAVSFGPKFPGKPSLEHGPDEYIEIEELLQNARIIVNALIKICGEEI